MGEQTPREKCESDATSTKCEKEADVHAETVGQDGVGIVVDRNGNTVAYEPPVDMQTGKLLTAASSVSSGPEKKTSRQGSKTGASTSNNNVDSTVTAGKKTTTAMPSVQVMADGQIIILDPVSLEPWEQNRTDAYLLREERVARSKKAAMRRHELAILPVIGERYFEVSYVVSLKRFKDGQEKIQMLLTDKKNEQEFAKKM